MMFDVYEFYFDFFCVLIEGFEIIIIVIFVVFVVVFLL